jgi:hypothetical protein
MLLPRLGGIEGGGAEKPLSEKLAAAHPLTRVPEHRKWDNADCPVVIDPPRLPPGTGI